MNAQARTLAILTHSGDRFRHRRFLVKLLIPRWEALGFKVVVADEEHFEPADLALLHVDLSVIPEAMQKLAQRYPRVINGRVMDIRKSRFSRLRVTPHSHYAGAVIVKTDWNSGGKQDFSQRLRASPAGAWLVRLGLFRPAKHIAMWFEVRRSWASRSVMTVGTYRIFQSKDQLPPGVWQNPHLIVERFAAEREGEAYCCRHWLFLGTAEVSRRTVSPHPVVKARERIEPLSEAVPDALRRIRQELGFDYGKFDYSIVDGEVFLYDANRTPGAAAEASKHRATVTALAPGIEAFAK